MIRSLTGRFYRIVFAHDLGRALAGATAPEGRFHHGGQQALYASPSLEAAGFAVASYLRPDDPRRVVMTLDIAAAGICDLREPDTLAALGLDGTETSVPWQPERQRGQRATTWRASDAVRRAGADGMIYTARTAPERWHLVLFRWNAPGGPVVRQHGAAVDWAPAPV